MLLSLCKTCGHHICVMGNKVYCGYKIDREEREILKDNNKVQSVMNCPKEKITAKGEKNAS